MKGHKPYTQEPDEDEIAYPLPGGFEGSGTVIENGGGVLGWRLVGKRVAFTK